MTMSKRMVCVKPEEAIPPTSVQKFGLKRIQNYNCDKTLDNDFHIFFNI